ncbi:hypothetical protein RRG08_002328 [Elysia crispata]|uniref:Uncharacterized protein n=1 Tax=Elysia crispata TaxID=231223 RepID=A0AAE1DD40_9GAST|nr:hypothetical protein RRG08_002328 [Elysia crispata]
MELDRFSKCSLTSRVSKPPTNIRSPSPAVQSFISLIVWLSAPCTEVVPATTGLGWRRGNHWAESESVSVRNSTRNAEEPLHMSLENAEMCN